MNDFEQILWRRNKELMDEQLMLVRQLALVLISPNHEAAVQASKEAFATLELTDPFKPVEVVQATEKARGAA
jgi:hypothetical protein